MRALRILPWLLAGLLALAALPANADGRFYISSVSESRFQDAPALSLRLTQALNPASNLSRYIQVTPAPQDSRWVADGDGSHWVLPFVEPETDYSISVTRAPRSVDGMRLEDVPVARDGQASSSFRWQVRTRAVAAGASFASQGQYLVGPLQNGLPVSVTNLDEVTLDLFRVRDAEVERFLTDWGFDGRVYIGRLNQIGDYAELFHTARYPTAGRRNQRHTFNLNLDPVLDRNQPGIYVAVLRMPGRYEYNLDARVFSVSDIGLHLRRYRESLVVHAHSISSGEPIQRLNLSFWWPADGRRAASGMNALTGIDGVYRLDGNDQPRVLVARRGAHTSFLQLDRAALDLSAFDNATRRHRRLQGFLYGPRDLYRPGEEVAINLLLRDHDGRALPAMPVQARVFDARGRLHGRFTWTPGPEGLYQHRFGVGADAATGRWRLSVGIDGTDLEEDYEFQVEEFLPEKLALGFYDGDRNQRRYAGPGELRVPVQGDYLYGAPAAGNKVDAVLRVQPALHIFDNWPDYRFGNAAEPVNPASLQVAPIQLDAQGHGELVIADQWAGVQVPLGFTISASLYETGGRPVTRTQRVIRLPDRPALVGVQALFDGRPAANAEAGFRLVSVDRQGSAQPDRLELRLIRKHREVFWQFDENRGWYREQQSNDYTAAARTLEFGGEPLEVQLPLEWGDYELEVTSASGAVTRYSFRTDYGGFDFDAAGRGALKPDSLALRLDRQTYAPGDTAQLDLRSPVAGAALLNVESGDGVVHSQRFDVQRGDNRISLAIPPDWDRHDLYLSAMVLVPADQVSELTPTRAIGIVHLDVQREDAVARVSIEAPARSEPNRPLSARVRLENPQDFAGQQLYVTLALVDMGVLNVTDYRRPRPEIHFFGPRRFEADYFDVYGRIIENLGYEMRWQRFGGGFDENGQDLSRGGEQPQSEVQILSFFSAPLALQDGLAEASFDLPAFNGRAKWMAVVFGARSYGSAEAETVIADRLVAQLGMPRFLASGDTSQVSLDLHNLSGGDQALRVAVEYAGAISGEAPPAELQLADRQKQSLSLAVRAGDSEGQGVIRLRIGNGTDLEIRREWRIGVRSAWPWPTRYLRQTLAPGSTWRPEFRTDDLRAATLRAQVSLSDRPPVNFAEHLEQLLRYPYGCLEQTASAALPWLLVDSRMAGGLELDTLPVDGEPQPYSDELRARRIAAGVARLLDKQLGGGGFGYWDSGDQESYWGSVYAADVLVEARRQGLSVDEARLQSALQRLDEYLRRGAAEQGWSESNDYTRFAYRAYAGYVLARAKAASLGQLRRLYDQSLERNLDQSGLAWMHLAAALHLSQDPNRARAALARALSLQRADNSYYRDYGTPLRDTALMLALALEHDFEPGDLVQRLIDQMRGKRWFSTQERIALLRVARHFAAMPSQWQALWRGAGGDQGLDRNGVFRARLDAAQVEGLQGISAAEQTLYAEIVYQGAPLAPPRPYAEVLRIDRTYYDLQGREIDGAELHSGDLVVVRLQVGARDQQVPEALVVDLLPAGLEIENPNLANASVSLDELVIGAASVGDYFRNPVPDYQEYRDDRFVAAVEVSPGRGVDLFYLARAVTPGDYAVPGPYVEDMYRPDFRALGPAPARLRVR